MNENFINQNQDENFNKKKIGMIGSMLWVYGDRQNQIKNLCKNTVWNSEDLELKDYLEKQLIQLRKILNLQYEIEKRMNPIYISLFVTMGFFLIPQIVLKIFNEKQTIALQVFQSICALLMFVELMALIIIFFKYQILTCSKLHNQIQKLNNSQQIKKKNIFFKLKGEFERGPDQQQLPKWMNYVFNQGKTRRMIWNQFNFVQVYGIEDKKINN